MSLKVKSIVMVIVSCLITTGVTLGTNGQAILFHWYGLTLPTNVGTLSMMFFAIGTLMGLLWSLGTGAANTEQNIAKLKEWQQQDNKLAIEVQKDKEKQLEAKIATLEAALKQALNK